MKILRFLLLLFSTWVIWLAVHQYFFCPRFSFHKGNSFSGDRLYNPYSGIGQGRWIKCHFHAHTDSWGGMTDGHGDAEEVRIAYESLGYSVHTISEYQKINKTYEKESGFIPAYEHGYNMQKAHQLVLGSEEVVWLDYIFPQTLSNKQRVINALGRDTGSVVVLNHPAMGHGYEAEDFQYLDGFECMEILNPGAVSLDHWDEALSEGRPVFAMGNDDVHKIRGSRRLGKFCTWLHVVDINRGEVLKALKEGRGYAMQVGQVVGEDSARRRQRMKNELPKLASFHVVGDTITVSFDRPAREILFSGEHGKKLAVFSHIHSASYVIGKTNSYVRVTASFEDGSIIYLNPVFRYKDQPLMTASLHTINRSKTTLFTFLGILVLSVWGLVLIRIFFPRFFRNKMFRQYPDPSPAA